jgi:hypothetical protein
MPYVPFMNMLLKRRGLVALLAVAVALVGSMAYATDKSPGGEDPAVAEQRQRHALIRKIVLEWAPYVQSIHGEDVKRWADRMVPVFRHAETKELQAAAGADTFEGMTNALLGQHAPSKTGLPGGAVPKSIGALAADLSFTPLDSCNLVDTRRAGGPLQAGNVRNFRGAGQSFADQGGSATNCGIPFSPAALLVSVSAISPTTSGYFTLWPYGQTRPLASNISFHAGQNIQNEIALRTRQGLTSDFSVFANGNSHLVVNVLGYFSAPEPTALQCKYTQDFDTTDSSQYLMVHPGPCDAGYTAVGVECREGSPQAHLVGTYGGACTFANTSGQSVTYTARRQCCRVPGR